MKSHTQRSGIESSLQLCLPVVGTCEVAALAGEPAVDGHGIPAASGASDRSRKALIFKPGAATLAEVLDGPAEEGCHLT